MAFKPNVNFGASNVIDPTAGARQALQSVGGLLDDYGKRQQSTQEMLLREQGRQDALVQQDIANKRADAQLQLSQNQDTRAAEKSAQDTEEFGIKKNTQKQIADFIQQAQGAQVGGLTTAQGLDLSNKFDAMLANGMSGEQAAAATQSASEAVMASNLKDPRMGAQFLAEIKQRSFGDVDSAKLSDLQRVTAQPFEKKIETDEQQAFQAEQNKLTRDQSAAQFNKTYRLQADKVAIEKQDRDSTQQLYSDVSNVPTTVARESLVNDKTKTAVGLMEKGIKVQLDTLAKSKADASAKLTDATALNLSTAEVAKLQNIIKSSDEGIVRLNDKTHIDNLMATAKAQDSMAVFNPNQVKQTISIINNSKAPIEEKRKLLKEIKDNTPKDLFDEAMYKKYGVKKGEQDFDKVKAANIREKLFPKVEDSKTDGVDYLINKVSKLSEGDAPAETVNKIYSAGPDLQKLAKEQYPNLTQSKAMKALVDEKIMPAYSKERSGFWPSLWDTDIEDVIEELGTKTTPMPNF